MASHFESFGDKIVRFGGHRGLGESRDPIEPPSPNYCFEYKIRRKTPYKLLADILFKSVQSGFDAKSASKNKILTF